MLVKSEMILDIKFDFNKNDVTMKINSGYSFSVLFS